VAGVRSPTAGPFYWCGGRRPLVAGGFQAGGKVLFFLASLRGGVEERKPCPVLWFGGRRRRSSDTKNGAPLSATKICRPTLMASRWPFSMPDRTTGASSTSMRRPFPEIETAGGRSSLSCITGGSRGPDCIVQFLCRFFVVKSRDLSANRSVHEVLAVIVPVPLEN
jgi:hypothetical protein